MERLLNVVDRVHRATSRREIFHFHHALVRLKTGQYPDAEEAMPRAERALPVPAEFANCLDANAPRDSGAAPRSACRGFGS